MKKEFEIEIEKKHMLFLAGFLAILAGIIFVGAVYNNIPNPGHGADNVKVNINGVEKTLQEAIDSDLVTKLVAGSGITLSPTTGNGVVTVSSTSSGNVDRMMFHADSLFDFPNPNYRIFDLTSDGSSVSVKSVYLFIQKMPRQDDTCTRYIVGIDENGEENTIGSVALGSNDGWPWYISISSDSNLGFKSFVVNKDFKQIKLLCSGASVMQGRNDLAVFYS